MRKSPIVINLVVTITIAVCVTDEKFLEGLRHSFNFFDVNNDGYISKKDVEDFFDDRSKTSALGMSTKDLNLMKAGLLGTIKECGGERINWEQYVKFNTKGGDSSFTMEVVTHVQGREPVTVEKMAELWNVDKERLMRYLKKGSLQDLVSAEEVLHYLNNNE
ncbi:uncharacterized protein LOC111046412 isoform X2 [Nilaparvata lugens]|nr:uncharacterized protein LOC111046412 isoform X2 [Nilaparvata lugens]XP_039282214.1 uncharacterized protein LOC111046412 isoform X2 [Nilaparvata lugens]XP_039282215.1 uncharacterized protein LOC111046412 isoform X2 [Nilaparvata lugens]